MARFTPFPEPDPLDDIAGTERLRLADGVLLTAGHFETEQLYHRARMARLLAYLQGAGTVAGLDPRWQINGAEAAELAVTPGLAVDYRGRLLELPYEACLQIGDWVDHVAEEQEGGPARIAAARRNAGGGLPQHMIVDLFAEFRAFARRPEYAFATGNANRIDGVQATLSDDAVHLNMVIRDAADDRLPESMISRLIPGAITVAAIHTAKRERLWSALQPRDATLAPDPGLPETEHDLSEQDWGGVLLGRLAIPLVDAGGGDLRFDTAFDMTSGAVAPDLDGRLYSYSAAELALIHDLRR